MTRSRSDQNLFAEQANLVKETVSTTSLEKRRCMQKEAEDNRKKNIHSEHGTIAPAFVTALAEEEQKVLHYSGTFEISN